MFVLPVWRDGGHFMILSQYQDTCFLLTFLEVSTHPRVMVVPKREGHNVVHIVVRHYPQYSTT